MNRSLGTARGALGHNPAMDAELKGLLQRRPFVWFLAARSLAGIANQMLMVALAWNMYDLTGSAWDLGDRKSTRLNSSHT